MPPFPSPTKQWHTTSYPAIFPSRPALSLAGKSILISGAGTGIGARTAESFAQASASHIAILGRRQAKLDATASHIRAAYPNTSVYVYVADMTDASAVNTAFEDFVHNVGGKIDILVSNASSFSVTPPIASSDPTTWMSDISTNILGALHLTQAFLAHGKPDGIIINVSSALSLLSGPGTSAYAVSKEAGLRFFQIVGMENEGLRIVSVHPGVVGTDMNAKTELAPMDDGTLSLPLQCSAIRGLRIDLLMNDAVSLPADFMVWLASEEAAFLKGKYVWANWDVTELVEGKVEIAEKRLLEMWLNGVPFEAEA
jgi:NAD(P)-dependent dehydrogenase (short-subunit alcohol dehydrogenase family)